MGHVVWDVQLCFLSHGRNGVALTSLGAKLMRNEVRTTSLFSDLLRFWVAFRVVFMRSLLNLHDVQTCLLCKRMCLDTQRDVIATSEKDRSDQSKASSAKGMRQEEPSLPNHAVCPSNAVSLSIQQVAGGGWR